MDKNNEYRDCDKFDRDTLKISKSSNLDNNNSNSNSYNITFYKI